MVGNCVNKLKTKATHANKSENPIFTALIFMSTILGKLSFITRFDDG